MPYTVEIPGGRGTVEVADDVPLEEARLQIEKQFPPNGAEIAERLAAEPDYQPTTEEFQLYKDYAKEKQASFIDSFAQGVDYMLGVAGRGAAAGVTEGAALNPANYLEAFAQGSQQLYGMVAQSQDPNSALFKLKDLINGTGTIESQRQQFLEARKFNQDLAKYESGESTFLPKEMVNPEYVQAAAMVLDPTLALPGLGEVFGAGKLATKGVGLAARGVGRGVSALARPVEAATKAGERILAEAINVSPEALSTAARTTGLASAVGVAPAVGVVGAVPLIATTAREAGQALATAGENLLTQPSRIGPLEAIGRIPGANLRQRTLGIIGQYGGDAALDTALRATAGSIEGGAIGAGLGYLGGGEEGAGFGAGSGAAMGAAGTAAARGYQKLTGKAAREARQGDFDRYVATQDENTASLLRQIEDQHGLDVASGYMDATALMRGQLGDVNVTLLSAEDYRKKFGTNTRGVQIPEADTPAIYVNADIFGQGKGDSPLYTLGHEIFHALERSEQLASKASEIKDALVGSYVVTDGVPTQVTRGLFDNAEIDRRFNEYRNKLSREQADQLAQYDTQQKRADFVASEIAAEYTGALFAGQKPDALLRGFSGLTRTLLDAALTKNSDSALNRIAQRIENTFGLKPLDSVLFPDLKQASPQVNAMLRDLVRARRRLDERILAADNEITGAIKPTDMGNPIAAKVAQDFGIAEQLPDGSVRWLSDDEINAREWRDNQAVQDILLTRPGARMVDGIIQGRFSPEQLTAIEQSQQVSSRMKDKIRAVAGSLNNGNSIFIDYNAATKRVKNRITGNYTSKYSSGIRMTQRELLPYAFYFSKADNPVIKAIDLTKVRRAVEGFVRKDGSIDGIWENMDGFMSDLAKYFTNLDSPRRQPSAVALDSDAKAKFMGDLVNEMEKGGRKFVRDFRLDRMGAVEPRNFRARISEEAIQFSKMRWMPSENVGDTKVTGSEEGYRIVSKDKHRLYGPDGKLIGIYDTQLEAERKADATETRLQPEIDQQQRPARNEVRQTPEAGGRNRPVSRTQGSQAGGEVNQPVRQAGDVVGNFDALVASAPEVRFMPIESQPENAPVSGRLSDGQRASIDELSSYYAQKTPERVKVLRAEAVDSLASRLVNKGVPVQDANAIASKTFSKIRKGVSGALQVISGMGLSDLSRMAGTGKPTVERRPHINPNWLTSAFEAFATDEGLALMKAQQVATQLNKAEQAKVAAGESVEAAKASGVRQSTMQQGMEFVLGEMNADRKAFGSSLREDLNSPPRVYASVLEGQKFGSQGNYNVFFEWKTQTPMVVTSHHHYGVANGVTGIHAQGNVGDKNARSFGNPANERFDTLPSGKQVLDTHLLVGNEGVPDARAHQLTVSIPESALANIRKAYKERGVSGVDAELNKIAVSQMVGSASQGKTFSYTTKEGIPPMVAIQRNRTEAYVLDPDLSNVGAVTIVSNSPKEVALIKKNLQKAFENNGSQMPKVKVVSAESGASKNPGRKAITDEYFKLTGQPRFMPSDTDYLAAVKAGDTQAAQQMVDQAAKAAGYVVGPVWHGTNSKFNEFKQTREVGGDEYGKGFYFSEVKGVAERYGDNLVPAYLALKNPVKVGGAFADGDLWKKTNANKRSDIATNAKAMGYDGVVRFARGIDDSEMLEIVAFDPSQIKSADPITRDNSGNVIPLSQRFQQSNADIRYMPETTQRKVGSNIDFANPPTEEKAIGALNSSKQPFWRQHDMLSEGTPVGVRIDIPAFLNKGTYVQTIHEPATPGNVGDRIGYDTSVRLAGPVRFFVKEGSQESKLGAVAIKEGRAAKHPIATVEGRLIKDRSIPSDIETWTPVGMDPKKHSYFYDKRTDRPVIGGSESYSVGNTVFVKDPVYGKPEEFRYMPQPDPSVPGAYSVTGGFRILPGKTRGRLRVYGPSGALVGIAGSLDEAQRMIQRKLR